MKGSSFVVSIIAANSLPWAEFLTLAPGRFYLPFGRLPPESSLHIAAARKATRLPASAREGLVMDSDRTLLFLDD